MDRIRKNMVPHPSISTTFKYGDKGTCPIDQQGVQRFNIDPTTGRPILDLTVVLRSQGLEQQKMLAELGEFKATYLPEDISNEDALKYYKPRLCQLPSELAEYNEMLTKQALDEQAKKKSAEEQRLLFEQLEEEEKQRLEEQKKKEGIKVE